MNICFYTYSKVYSTKGGTERTTISVASAMTRYYNCRCFSIYEIPSDTVKEDCFVAEYCWNVKRDWNENVAWWRKIILENNIDVLIDQGTFIYVKHFKEAVKGLGCKVILAHHFEPGAETSFFTFKRQLKYPQESFTILNTFRWLRNILLYPYLRKKSFNSLQNAYREAYQFADKVVLLSKGFIKLYQNFGRFEDNEKFAIIPNGLSFSDYLDVSSIKKKKNIALIVSRLDETHKRLSLAIKIWGLVKNNSIVQDWTLHIIGDGPSRKNYENLARKNRIKDIKFLGRKDPMLFYKDASVFLMTSRSESWGLTLTEAQQMGVVPIAFNTYTSLRDIITDGVDGYIIPECNIEEYASKLIELMADDNKRHEMAANGIQNCKRFSQEKIAEKWWSLLNSL